MRKVEIYKYELPAGETRWVKCLDTQGMFIEFGLGIIEGADSNVSFSTGIVELDDGTIRNVPVEMLKFIDK